ncbi:hypothetical protein OC835_005324 [Tilletia horrida]|nr:hypothetical protein OC835_005324 [Tilletia horrida]KAK0557788.1 hypothetical protein OC844_005491 [Tilletia horrida]
MAPKRKTGPTAALSSAGTGTSTPTTPKSASKKHRATSATSAAHTPSRAPAPAAPNTAASGATSAAALALAATAPPAAAISAQDDAEGGGASSDDYNGSEGGMGETQNVAASDADAGPQEAANMINDVSSNAPSVVASGGNGKPVKADAQPQWKNDSFAPGWPSSLVVLLSWLKDNYEKWKGGGNDSQLSLAADIQQLIVGKKCRANRTPPSIVEKIKALEKSFRSANDWRLATGQGILDDAEAREADAFSEGDDEDEEERASRLSLVYSGVEAEVLKRCEYYNELLDIMGDRISCNPSNSYSTTSKNDAAARALRRGLVCNEPRRDGALSEEEDGTTSEDEGKHVGQSTKGEEKDRQAEDGGQEDSSRTKAQGKTKAKAKEVLLVKKETSATPGRPSDTGRKFGKQSTASSSKRKPSAVELAIETRTKEKTQQEADINKERIKAERSEAVRALARDLRDHDSTISFQDSIQQAKALYEDI